MAKVRVYELAKEFGVESKAVMVKLNEMGEFVRSASSTIEAPVVRRLKEAFASKATEQPAQGSRPRPASPSLRGAGAPAPAPAQAATPAPAAAGVSGGSARPGPGPQPGISAGTAARDAAAVGLPSAPRSAPEAATAPANGTAGRATAPPFAACDALAMAHHHGRIDPDPGHRGRLLYRRPDVPCSAKIV